MKSLIRSLAACAVLGAALNTIAQVQVGVDPTQTWIGFMNVFSLPADCGGYQFCSSWGTADLQASFSGSTVTLSPNINVWETTDTYWVKADGVSPNKTMDASFYVQNDALAGQTVTFSGSTLANTLVSPYTSVAFVKDFVSNYSSFTESSIALVGGVNFSLSLGTTAGDHIQYGFETIGPDANPLTAASLGSVIISPVPEPSTIAVAAMGGLAALSLIRRKI